MGYLGYLFLFKVDFGNLCHSRSCSIVFVIKFMKVKYLQYFLIKLSVFLSFKKKKKKKKKKKILNSNRNLLSECSYISRTISHSRSLPFSRNLSTNIFNVVTVYSYLKSHSYLFYQNLFLSSYGGNTAPFVFVLSNFLHFT